MNGLPIRRVVLAGPPEQLGIRHGEAYAGEIRRYAAERVRLASDGSWAQRTARPEEVLELAEAMLPAHRAYAPDLYEEMLAMGRGAGLSPPEMVIVGGFTDFVDAVRGLAGGGVDEDDCTAVLAPDSACDGPGFLAQTWDMHDSATQHVVMLELAPEGAPAALVFSTVGCVGQIGMNEAGICVGINNLSAASGGIGVTWPFVVRKVLQQTDVEAALACIVEAELAGAHNYLLLDAKGRGYDVEAMPGCCAVEKLEAEPLVHTNHCLARETVRLEATKHPELLASSRARLAKARELVAVRPITREGLVALTREPDAICQRPRPPFRMESSGAMIMRPQTREVWAVWGIPADNEFERFELPEA